MKYTLEITIDLPRDEVIDKFDNPDNMKYWQKGFVSFEHLSGEPGTRGATSKLTYKWGKREMEMIETITERSLPDAFHATYDTKGAFNIQRNYFYAQGKKTKWVSETEFEFSGIMKFMAFFMGKKSFKKQSLQFMNDFKAFAEGNPKYEKN